MPPIDPNDNVKTDINAAILEYLGFTCLFLVFWLKMLNVMNKIIIVIVNLTWKCTSLKDMSNDQLSKKM